MPEPARDPDPVADPPPAPRDGATGGPAATPHRRSRERGPFWPFEAGAAILASLVLVAVLVTAAVVGHRTLAWPPDPLLGPVLLAAVLLGLVPIILMVLNRVSEGGSVAVAGVLKVVFDAARTGPNAGPRAHVSGNLGAPPGVAVHDSGGGNIMEALDGAVSNPVAVVDLGDGDAWWETRLLLLLSGAARLGRPRAVVFVATRHGVRHRFLGWGVPADLLRCQLAVSDDDIRRAYHGGRANGLRWQLGTPTPAGQGATLPWSPAQSPSDVGWTLIPRPSPRELAPEAFLMEALAVVEREPGRTRQISVGRLDDLVGPVLRTASVESSAPDEEKIAAVLATTHEFVAVVDRGEYATMISRDLAVNAVLRGVVQSGTGRSG